LQRINDQETATGHRFSYSYIESSMVTVIAFRLGRHADHSDGVKKIRVWRRRQWHRP
jgi:hypothetical protein